MHASDAASRREGFLLGVPVGATLAAGAPPAGRRHAASALGDALLEELLGGGVDLRRLAGRWVRWRAADGHGVDDALAEALAHLEEFDAPPTALAATGAWAIVVALPAALAAASPRTMVAGAFHTARLVDPDPVAGLAAVSVVVAAARYLEGSRDVMPEVLALLRSNNAPAVVYDRVADIARLPRARATPPGPGAPALDVAAWALRVAEHERDGVGVLQGLAHAGTTATAGAVLGALVGARDGIEQWPAAWRDGAGEEVRLRLLPAERLGGGAGAGG
jgi:hypothetical protein